MAVDAAPRTRRRGAADPQQRASITTRRSSRPADGTLHATYSYFVPPASAKQDAQERLPRKAIKHAHFNEAWIMEPSAHSLNAVTS